MPFDRFDVYMRPFLIVMSCRSSVATPAVVMLRMSVGDAGLATFQTFITFVSLLAM
jgi:hypothetical protein